MGDIAGIPYSIAEFDRHGGQVSQPDVPPDTEQVIIVSHGWNNDRGEAETLYRNLFSNVAAVNGGALGLAAIVGVIWPSKRFDFDGDGNLTGGAGNVAAAAAGDAGGDERAMIDHALAEMERVFADSGKEAQLATLRELAGRISEPSAQGPFVATLRDIVKDEQIDVDHDGSDAFFNMPDPRDVFIRARQASAATGNRVGNGSNVAAAGLGDLFKGAANAVGSLLNITTYYEMKKRAGTVGERGLAPLVDALAGREKVRHIHLVGHSFGARLVAAAAMHSTTPKLRSMTLLQAAFSHNGFAEQGYFRKVVKEKRLAGPIVITHSRHDKAVGKAYAIASRISRDDAKEVGDANDRFGGLGANGAQKMGPGEVSSSMVVMLDVGTPYALQGGIVHNLESAAFISHHSDVAGREVAWAVSQAIAAP